MDKMTTKDLNGDFKRYFKEIKSLFPVFGKAEKRFFSEFRGDVTDYASLHPELSSSEVVAYFGEPTAIVANYLTETDAAVLLQQVKRTKWIKYCVIIIIALAVILSGIRAAFLYRSFIEGRDAYIHREIIETHTYGDDYYIDEPNDEK
jgi:hypothetical protein